MKAKDGNITLARSMEFGVSDGMYDIPGDCWKIENQ
jgi:hypothetical protein